MRPSTPGSPTVYPSWSPRVVKQFDHPLPKSPWPCLLPWKSNNLLFKVLAVRCDWGQQFDQLPLWRVEPLALSLYLKVTQFDFALWDTGTYMYITYWLDPTSLWCPSSCDTIHTQKSNYFWHTLLRIQEWSNNLTIYFKEPMALLYFVETQTIWLKVLAIRFDWGQQFDQLPLWRVESLALPFNWSPTNLTLFCETLALICMLPTD